MVTTMNNNSRHAYAAAARFRDNDATNDYEISVLGFYYVNGMPQVFEKTFTKFETFSEFCFDDKVFPKEIRVSNVVFS